jgi:hypothetical protein
MSEPPRCYTIAEVRAHLHVSERTFRSLWKAGRYPFLEEVLPRFGRRIRFRADLIDRYVSGQWRSTAAPLHVAGRSR